MGYRIFLILYANIQCILKIPKHNDISIYAVFILVWYGIFLIHFRIGYQMMDGIYEKNYLTQTLEILVGNVCGILTRKQVATITNH